MSKTTDNYEEGSVKLSTTGPLVYEVTPAELNIDHNETKRWDGKIHPGMSTLPAPGTSAPAALIADYDIRYSRPQGTGTQGVVMSTYECGEKGCQYHQGVKGTHEIVNEKGQKKYDFIVYSISCDLPKTTYMCYMGPTSVTATGYPGGGRYKWETSSKNIRLKNTDSSTVTVLYKGPGRGEEHIKCTYTINGISYEATGVVNTIMPQNTTLNRGANFFDDNDRVNMARMIGLQYVVQCIKPWSNFFQYEYDFEYAGGIIASDPSIKQQMDNWYQSQAQQLINSGKESKPLSSKVQWRTQESTLLGFALGTSEYKVTGIAKVECRNNGDLAVKIDAHWTISDKIDWNSYEDVKKNYKGAWHWGFLPENILDIVGDQILGGQYNLKSTYDEKTYVDFKK